MMSESRDLFETLSMSAKAGTDRDGMEKQIWDLFGETTAVLVLDSTGFSRTTQKKGIVYFLTIIARMRDIGRRIFDRHGATRVRAEADNLFAEFNTPTAALDAAFEVHRYFRENELLLDENAPYKVCIGIGYGRLLKSSREGMYGDEMNLASKLGQTLITEAAYEALSNREHLIAHRRFVTISGVELPYFEVTPK
jgi:adenylate cyclase